MKATLIVIQNETDHADAKRRIEKLMESSDSQDRARMVAQARLVEAYERTAWPRTAPTVPVLLAYLMDQHGLSRADLVPLLGTASRVSEVLSGKRDLSMSADSANDFKSRQICWFPGAERGSRIAA